MGGIPGLIFQQFGWTAVIAVLTRCWWRGC